MKEVHEFSIWLLRQLLVCAVVLVMASCATEPKLGGEVPLPAKVMRVKGGARWSSDDGKTWRPIRVGDNLLPGNLVQTAANSRIDIRFGAESGVSSLSPAEAPRLEESRMPNRIGSGGHNGLDNVGGLSSREVMKLRYLGPVQNRVFRLWENSILGLDELTRRLTKLGAHVEDKVQLDLRTGRITFSVRGILSSSDYQIKYPNGIVRFGNGTYDISAEGAVRVLAGKASVTWPGSPEPQVVLGRQQFDARTGVLGPLIQPR